MSKTRISGKQYASDVISGRRSGLEHDAIMTLVGVADAVSMDDEGYSNASLIHTQDLWRMKKDETMHDIDQFSDLLAGRALRAILEGRRPYTDTNNRIAAAEVAHERELNDERKRMFEFTGVYL